MANSTTTTTLPPPCRRPIRFARVSLGMCIQSQAPKTAASRPPTIPAAMFQKATVLNAGSPVSRWTMSKTTAVDRSPNGRTINIGCTGCPKSLTLLSIAQLLFDGGGRATSHADFMQSRCQPAFGAPRSAQPLVQERDDLVEKRVAGEQRLVVVVGSRQLHEPLRFARRLEHPAAEPGRDDLVSLTDDDQQRRPHRVCNLPLERVPVPDERLDHRQVGVVVPSDRHGGREWRATDERRGRHLAGAPTTERWPQRLGETGPALRIAFEPR